MAGGTVAAFWAVSFLFVVTPGADWAYAIAAGLRHRVVLPAVGGLLAGHLAATAVVAAGVGALLARSPLLLSVLTAVGAVYLVWLGIGMLARPALPQAGVDETPRSWLRQAAKGAGISGLNPKVFLLFLALLPQFTDPNAAWPLASQIVVLGLVHVTSCAVVYTGVGTGARRVLRARPAAALAVTRLLRRRDDRDRRGAAGRKADRLDTNWQRALSRRAMEDQAQAEQAAPQIQARIRTSFERQGLMRHLGARLGHIGPGCVHIVLPNRPEVTQQHGYIHAGATSASPTAQVAMQRSRCSPRTQRCSRWSTRSISWHLPSVITSRPWARS